MSRFFLSLVLSGLMVLGWSAKSSADDVVYLDPAAEIILDQYFSALSSGDTYTIRGLLGGALAQRQAPLLANPSYSAHLQEIFGGWVFSVSPEPAQMADSLLEVRYSVSNGSETMNRQLFLRAQPTGSADKAYLIIDERELP